MADRVTQVDIAKACKLDVSSVNKILNRKRGPVFLKSTIERVFRTARRMGWKPQKTDLRQIKDVVLKIRKVYRQKLSSDTMLGRIWMILGECKVG